MRTIITFLLTVVVFLSTGYAQPNDDKLRELIRRIEEAEKSDKGDYNSPSSKRIRDAFMAFITDKAVLKGLDTFLPGQSTNERFAFHSTVIVAFVKKLTLYPYSDGLEINATPKSFMAALDNIREGGTIEVKSGPLGRFCDLTACSTPPSAAGVRVALQALLSTSGSFTDAGGRFHRNAYNAVLRVLTPETIAKNKKYFDDPFETCSVMLHAGSRFIRPDGELDEKAYRGALQQLTTDRIEAVKKMMKIPSSKSACDAILRP
jgi:hypothetical protein